jgi:hypothetical protein
VSNEFLADLCEPQPKDKMKMSIRFLIMALVVLAPLSLVWGQSSPAAKASSAPSSLARTDVYHVLFDKAAPGKAVQLAELLKTPDPKDPMPGHFILLRHQEGDAWDYCLITHLGTKATVDATPFQVPLAMRDVSDWHTDTFVNGPPWDEFTKAMGISDDTKSKSAGSVYVVSVFRPTAGQRDEMEKILGAPPNRPSDTSAGTVLMQHLEGGPWTFLTVVRYNSWQDFATNDMNNATQSNKNEGGWFEFRKYSAYHTDTVANRIAP